MGSFLDAGSMALLLDHSDARREARIKRAAEIRKLVLAAIPETGTAPVWELTKALKGRATFVEIGVALHGLREEGLIAGDAAGYRRV